MMNTEYAKKYIETTVLGWAKHSKHGFGATNDAEINGVLLTVRTIMSGKEGSTYWTNQEGITKTWNNFIKKYVRAFMFNDTKFDAPKTTVKSIKDHIATVIVVLNELGYPVKRLDAMVKEVKAEYANA